ncbi:hypothetical protein ABMA27_006541 [Loxostege sticticalis]|uniref:Peptidase S1 domain-containing protein n=1 Tax=Loxostege sticticalis TaxID=481309 RepID=A0ABR3IJI6_LOXSC
MFTKELIISMVVTMIKAKSLLKNRVLGRTDDVVFPYVVSLQLQEIRGEEKYRVCTGTLIAPEWVVTAAHCLRPEVKFVRYGNMAIPSNSTESISKILKMFTHPLYKLVEPKGYVQFYDMKNDIGLILTQKIKMAVGKLSPVDMKYFTGKKVTYAGFGRSSDSFLDDIKPLRSGEGVITECPFNPHSHRVRPAMCVEPKHKKQHKTGDSGGPVFYDGKIIAVLSASVLRTSVYTPVKPYLVWIANTMYANKN